MPSASTYKRACGPQSLFYTGSSAMVESSSQQPLRSRVWKQTGKTATANTWVRLQELLDTLPPTFNRALKEKALEWTFVPGHPRTC